MKEKPKFTLALQVIVIIVIITLKMLKTFVALTSLKENTPNGSILMRKQVFFLFSQGKMFGKHVKNNNVVNRIDAKKKPSHYCSLTSLHIFRKFPRGIFKGTLFHGVSAG